MKSNYIREWRAHRGLTQAKLAAGMEVSQSYVTMVERGDRRYDQPFLEAAALVLACSPADLIAAPPGKFGGICTLLAKSSDEDIARIAAVISALVEPKPNGAAK